MDTSKKINDLEIKKSKIIECINSELNKIMMSRDNMAMIITKKEAELQENKEVRMPNVSDDFYNPEKIVEFATIPEIDKPKLIRQLYRSYVVTPFADTSNYNAITRLFNELLRITQEIDSYYETERSKAIAEYKKAKTALSNIDKNIDIHQTEISKICHDLAKCEKHSLIGENRLRLNCVSIDDHQAMFSVISRYMRGDQNVRTALCFLSEIYNQKRKYLKQ